VKKEILFPFRDGVLQRYDNPWRLQSDVARKTAADARFRGSLALSRNYRGRSAAGMIFVAGDMEYPVFLKDFLDMAPYMVRGVVDGEFEPCKKGANYGWRLVRSDP